MVLSGLAPTMKIAKEHHLRTQNYRCYKIALMPQIITPVRNDHGFKPPTSNLVLTSSVSIDDEKAGITIPPPPPKVIDTVKVLMISTTRVILTL